MILRNKSNSQSGKQLPVCKKSSNFVRQTTNELLLLCTTATLSTERKERISNKLTGKIDWDYLLKLVTFHGVAPLIAFNLSTEGLASQVPQLYLNQLRQIYNNTIYKNVLLSNELAKILSTFRQHGVDAIALKGTILAEQLYGNPALRTVVDMDILVRSEQLSIANSLLLDMSYEKVILTNAMNHPFHNEYCKNAKLPFFIELHWNLDDQKLVAIPQQEIWQRAQMSQIQKVDTLLLSPEDTLLLLCNNFSKPSDLLLKSLCDITTLIEKSSNILDWNYIADSSRSWGINISTYYSLYRSKELLRASVPEYVLEALKPGKWRCRLLNLLVNKEAFISTSKLNKLTIETYNLYRGLSMNHLHQTASILSNYRGSNGIWGKLRTVFWTILVFSTALGSTVVGRIYKSKWQVETSHLLIN